MSSTRIRTVLEMIKFEHSVFALPFALTGALLAARYAPIPGAAPGGPRGGKSRGSSSPWLARVPWR